VPACLLDVNVWLATAFEAHPAHRTAQAVLVRSTPAAPALFCRATQQSFLLQADASGGACQIN
jgi:predicted nucleic acid-binding protein